MLVFVFHPDVEVLAELVGRLRTRGLETAHAITLDPLVERAAKATPTLLALPEGYDVRAIAPLFALVGDAPVVTIPSNVSVLGLSVVVDTIVSRLASASTTEPHHTGSGEVRGDLLQLPLADLLQLLSMGRKTGTLTVTTSHAGGEIRLADGEIVDASFRRAEGMKAILRLLGETEGAFHFAPDAVPALRRVYDSTASILMEGTRQIDELKRHYNTLRLNRSIALTVDNDLAVDTNDRLVCEVVAVLGRPRTLEDLLDEINRPDLEIMEALVRLDATAGLRRIPFGDARPSLAGPEGMVVLRGLVRRLRVRGYRSPPRIVLTGSPSTVRVLRAAVPRLSEATPGSEGAGELSEARIVEATASLALGDGVVLDVVTVVDRTDIGSFLPMVLNGAVCVITFERPSSTLADVVEDLEIALVDARSVVDEAVDPGHAPSVALVIRATIEGMGGT